MWIETYGSSGADVIVNYEHFSVRGIGGRIKQHQPDAIAKEKHQELGGTAIDLQCT